MNGKKIVKIINITLLSGLGVGNLEELTANYRYSSNDNLRKPGRMEMDSPFSNNLRNQFRVRKLDGTPVESEKNKGDKAQNVEGEPSTPLPPPPLPKLESQLREELQLRSQSQSLLLLQLPKPLKESIKENIKLLNPKSSKEDVENAVKNIISELSKTISMEEIEEQIIDPNNAHHRIKRKIATYTFRQIAEYGQFKYEVNKKGKNPPLKVTNEQDILEERKAVKTIIANRIKNLENLKNEIESVNLKIKECNEQYKIASEKLDLKQMQHISEQAKEAMCQLINLSNKYDENDGTIKEVEKAIELLEIEGARQKKEKDSQVVRLMTKMLHDLFVKKQSQGNFMDVAKMFLEQLKLHFRHESGAEDPVNRFACGFIANAKDKENANKSFAPSAKTSMNVSANAREWELHYCQEGKFQRYAYISKDNPKEFLWTHSNKGKFSLELFQPIDKDNSLPCLYLKQSSRFFDPDYPLSPDDERMVEITNATLTRYKPVPKMTSEP
jgi:hypothetical protein